MLRGSRGDARGNPLSSHGGITERSTFQVKGLTGMVQTAVNAAAQADL
jgi:hypothetical protein